MTDPRWERSAARRNAREAARFPLLALSGDLQPVTGSELEARWERQRAGWEASDRRFARKARLCRWLLARRLPPAELAAVDRSFAATPQAPHYAADVYWCALRVVVRPNSRTA